MIGAREIAVQRVRSGSDIGKLIGAIEAEVHDLVAGVEPEVDVIGLGEVARRRVADRHRSPVDGPAGRRLQDDQSWRVVHGHRHDAGCGIAGGVMRGGAERVRSVGRGAGVPRGAIRSSRVFSAQHGAVQIELDTGDGDVVGRVDGERNGAGEDRPIGGRGEIDLWIGRVLGRHRRCHVGLDLGDRQRSAVDAHVVDLPAEILAPDGVAADAERHVRRLERSGERRGGDADAVDVEAQRRVVIGRGKMRPRICGQRLAAGR